MKVYSRERMRNMEYKRGSTSMRGSQGKRGKPSWMWFGFGFGSDLL